MREEKRVDNIKIENHIVTPDMHPTLSEIDFPGVYIDRSKLNDFRPGSPVRTKISNEFF